MKTAAPARAAAQAARPAPAPAAARPGVVPALRRCPCGGGCPGCVQALPRTDTPGDAWEREADRIADALMAGRTARSTLGAPPALQRLSSMASPTPEDAERGEADEASPGVQRLARGPATPGAGWAATLAAQRGGSALPGALAARFGPPLGTDLSAVRVHADGAAATLCDGIGARAFAHGGDLFFNRGEYRPAEPAGQRVIAHELAHVVQQRAAPGAAVQRLPALDHTGPDNIAGTNVHPWQGQPPVGNDYRLETDGGSPVTAWVAYAGFPEAERYWCHGFSLGTYARWGYSVWSGGPMARVIADEYTRVAPADTRAGDLAVWETMPDGNVFGHSARFTQPVVSGGALDDARSMLDSKNGRQPLASQSLAQLKAVPIYGAGVGVYRRR